MVWQKNGTPDTLTGTSDTVTISDLTKVKSNQIMSHTIGSGAVRGSLRVGDGSIDTGTNYALRRSNNGAADSTFLNTTFLTSSSGAVSNDDEFTIAYIANVSGQELLCIEHDIRRNTVGAGTVPSRDEQVGKWVTTTQMNNVQQFNDQAGDFTTDSNLSALGDVVATPAAVGGWVELDRTTLGSANANISVSSLPDKRYYKVLVDVAGQSSNSDFGVRFNSDSASNYSARVSFDGGADVTATTASLASTFTTDTPSTTPVFHVTYIANLAAKEKLLTTSQGVRQMTAGAGNAPQRSENAAKWVNTVDAINEITLTTAGAPTFNTGSQVVVLGWDPTDTHTTNFWEELASVELTSAADNLSSGTITAKKYLWVQCYTVASGAINARVTFNNDTGSNYAKRNSDNGSADGSIGNQAFWQINATTGNEFYNIFIINNSSNEKLMSGHVLGQGTAGAANATSRGEQVGKWANTVDQITEIDFTNAGAGDYAGGSFLKVWGSD